MIIVDKAPAARAETGDPVKLAIIGAGFSGRKIAHQVHQATPGMRVVAVANRTRQHAVDALKAAGATEIRECDSKPEFERVVELGAAAATEDVDLVCQSDRVDAIIEATGTIEFAAHAVINALDHGKHVIMCNVELDATLGPILKTYADRAGVILSNVDGDEPGVALNLIRFVRGIGLRPVVAGNLKGLYDRYRTPETQREFATQHGQKPTTMTSFADGTKLSMELAVLANATGFRVAKPGMYGPALDHVNESAEFYRDKLLPEGMVDFLVGAAPANGAFVLGQTDDPLQEAYLKYLKMGEGPLYTFHTPFHLPQLEAPTTVARAVLLGDATITPQGGPVCDAVCTAKRDLRAGETLDGLGGFLSYAILENYADSCRRRSLPMGLSEGCRLRKKVAQDAPISYEDVVLPEGRFGDRLRSEQDARFGPAESLD